MQVSDAGQLLRATLAAARILTRLRGLHPIGIRGVDLDIESWLQRSELIEDLDENAHKDMSAAFFVDMLAHRTKAAIFQSAADDESTDETPADERTRRAAQSDNPAHQALVMADGETCIPDRLMRRHQAFVLRLQPLVFIATSGAIKPHSGIDYRLAMVAHTGLRLVTVNLSIAQALDQLRALRIKYADSLMPEGASCRCRLFVIVWRDDFHPLHGKYTKRLQTLIQKANQDASADGLSIEYYNVCELQYEANTHELVPRHTVVDGDPRDDPALKTIAPAAYPTLFVDDIQAKLRDFRPGQVIRIERKDIELGYDELAYRMVRTRPPPPK